MTKRVIRSKNFNIFRKLISKRYNGYTLKDLCDDEHVFNEVEELASGCFVFVIELPDEDGAERVEALTMHKFNNSLSTMISKDAALSFHLRYLNEEERKGAEEQFNTDKGCKPDDKETK